jgi:hypothetical protein
LKKLNLYFFSRTLGGVPGVAGAAYNAAVKQFAYKNKIEKYFKAY